MNWEAFWLTVRLAGIVSTLLVAIGIPIAYWLTYSRWRWKFLVEAAVALPIVLPPTVLGFYVLVALGSRRPLGRWWESLTGHTLAFTFEGLAIGSLLYSLPFAVQPFAASFGATDFSPHCASSFKSGTGHGICAQLRAHARRVWRRAHGRRQYSRRDA